MNNLSSIYLPAQSRLVILGVGDLLVGKIMSEPGSIMTLSSGVVLVGHGGRVSLSGGIKLRLLEGSKIEHESDLVLSNASSLVFSTPPLLDRLLHSVLPLSASLTENEFLAKLSADAVAAGAGAPELLVSTSNLMLYVTGNSNSNYVKAYRQ